MIDLTRSLTIPAPAAVVWAVLADHRRDPEWRTGVTAMEPDAPGPARPGTRVHEVLRIAGRTRHIDSVVDAVDPGRGLAWHTTTGSDVHGSREVEPLGDDRCRVTLTIVVTPHGTERVVAPLFRRILARNLASDLGALATLVGRAHPALI